MTLSIQIIGVYEDQTDLVEIESDYFCKVFYFSKSIAEYLGIVEFKKNNNLNHGLIIETNRQIMQNDRLEIKAYSKIVNHCFFSRY